MFLRLLLQDTSGSTGCFVTLLHPLFCPRSEYSASAVSWALIKCLGRNCQDRSPTAHKTHNNRCRDLKKKGTARVLHSTTSFPDFLATGPRPRRPFARPAPFLTFLRCSSEASIEVQLWTKSYVHVERLARGNCSPAIA